MLAYNELSNRYSRQCRLTCQLCVLSSYLSLSCLCHAGVMIVVWRTPGNIETRGHLVIVGTLPDSPWRHIDNTSTFETNNLPPLLNSTSARHFTPAMGGWTARQLRQWGFCCFQFDEDLIHRAPKWHTMHDKPSSGPGHGLGAPPGHHIAR